MKITAPIKAAKGSSERYGKTTKDVAISAETTRTSPMNLVLEIKNELKKADIEAKIAIRVVVFRSEIIKKSVLLLRGVKIIGRGDIDINIP